MHQDRATLLDVRNLKKYFPVTTGLFSRVPRWIRAVDGVSFHIKEGETLGLVGESGCGKTTAGRVILRLTEPSGGEVSFRGRDILQLRGAELRNLRKEMQVIFQDPYSSLNPRMTVGDIIAEGIGAHRMASGRRKKTMVEELLEKVGLSASFYHRYPHEFSGGQRQRVAIARALSLNPKLIICDEPVSALDVSIQAQILNLLSYLKREFNLAYLFITHDLSVVEHISDRIAAMYLGELTEVAETDEFCSRPLHPYTIALMSAIFPPDPFARRKPVLLHGDVPSPIDPPQGCRFHTRCPVAEGICRTDAPVLEEKSPGHYVRCHLVKRGNPEPPLVIS
jgi:oligopeptide/dipeptide ABC transporter ATP-binding protein